MVTVMIIFQKYHLSERDYQTGRFFGNSTDISVKAGEIIFHDVSMQKKNSLSCIKYRHTGDKRIGTNRVQIKYDDS